MSFPRYPKYKPSGVEWLGDVPEHWEVKRLRQIGRLLKGGGGTKEDVVDAGVPCVRYGDLYTTFSYHITRPRGFVTPERVPDYTPLHFGDVLFAASGEKLAEIGKSAVNLLTAPAVCGGDVVILRPEIEVESRFLGYACDSPTAAMQKASLGRGTTVKHIYPDELRLILLYLPPLPEQRAIAAFLDRETAKIDGLVAEQQRLIELLKEKRQAVISHAVTKGLDPKAPMKPSGVEWLGDVPAHWEVVRNKALFAEFDERSESEDGELLTVSHLTGVTRRADKEVNMFLAETLSGYKRCEPGDLVINTMWAWMGALGVSPIAGLVSPSYNVYRQRSSGKLDHAYFDALCRTPNYRTEMKARSTGVWESRLRLYPDAFLDMRLPLPPHREQEFIAEWIAKGTTQSDRISAEAERSITLLQERRSALISAAVTGQIDVRNVVATEAA